MSQTTASSTPRIAIIGSGFSGLCLGIQLKGAGIESFTIFEKGDRLGGTWRDNTYPGAACDTPAFAYCFSFEQKTDWSHKWVPHHEILSYLEHCARKYELEPHIRLRSEIATARWSEEETAWHLRTADGQHHTADILISAVGQLNRPSVPQLDGLETFAGECFHSSRWNHDCELEGKRVAVIGNAASAVQLVPHVAGKAARLFVFQRSANWMVPQNNRPFSEAEKRRFTRFPLLAKLYRWSIWAQFELNWPVFRRNRLFARKMTQIALDHIRDSVSDPELREKLIPDYPIGGKRVLILDDYYPTLERDHVDLITDPIVRITPSGVETKGGDRLDVDVLILATGFESTSFLAPMRIEGRDGKLLGDAWRNGAEAYLGLAVAGFPNFFMMYGPNTNLGHNSIIFMIECQSRYVLDCIETMRRRRLRAVDLRPRVMQAYNEKLQRELSGTVWAAPARSWYKQSDGRITNNWSGSTIRYWWKTRRADLELYEQLPERGSEVATATRRAEPSAT